MYVAEAGGFKTCLTVPYIYLMDLSHFHPHPCPVPSLSLWSPCSQYVICLLLPCHLFVCGPLFLKSLVLVWVRRQQMVTRPLEKVTLLPSATIHPAASSPHRVPGPHRRLPQTAWIFVQVFADNCCCTGFTSTLVISCSGDIFNCTSPYLQLLHSLWVLLYNLPWGLKMDTAAQFRAEHPPSYAWHLGLFQISALVATCQSEAVLLKAEYSTGLL